MKTRMVRWRDASATAFDADALHRWMLNEGFRVQRYAYPPGTRFPPHRHASAKCDAVLSGRFAIAIGDVTHVLEAGDRIYLAAGITHEAWVVGEETVISLDGERTAE